MTRRSIAVIYSTAAIMFTSRTSAFCSPAGNVVSVTAGLKNVGSAATARRCCPRRCKDVSRLAASPLDKFMSGLADMMSPQKPDDGEMDSAEMQRLSEVSLKRRTEPQDVDEFRRGLIKQTRMDSLKKQQEFTGYDMYDLIVDKFDVPYDVQINKTVFAGKPVLCFNVMWKYLGQSSFHLDEQAYLEHLEALAQLLKEWDRIDHFKKVLADTRKRPNPYFGYAVALPLDLAPDTLAGYFDDSYF